jgi:Subtilase family
MTGTNYMQLSGTSFSAPVVSGSAAQILARHPNWTPNQVKGALMVTARDYPGKAGSQAGGVGEVTVSKAADLTSPPNPNQSLSAYVLGGGTDGQAFDSASWLKNVQSSASWNSASWASASWNSASWNSASWASASWNSASWASASWNSASWLNASWVDSSYEDAAEGDASADPSAYQLDPQDIADALADPLLAPDPEALPTAP